jgi:hypothetical protein
MARIELRDADILIRDGFGGTAAVDDLSISGSDTTLVIDTLAGLPNARTTVPIGARFTIATVATTIFTVTAQNANQQYTLTITSATGGNFDLVVDGLAVDDIAFDADAATIQAAINAVIGSGNSTVTGSGPFVVEFIGDYLGMAVVATIDDTDLTGAGSEEGTLVELHEGGTTWQVTFTPALDGGDLPANDDAIAFLPIQITVKVGDGNLTYTENKNYDYLLDRGNLDTVREGDEAPLEISLEFVYEFVKTGTGEAITPVDALKGIGGAADWTSTSSDQCESYCVDIVIDRDAPCNTAEDEITVFSEFRYDSLEFDLSAATIAVNGRCNVTEPEITRE